MSRITHEGRVSMRWRERWGLAVAFLFWVLVSPLASAWAQSPASTATEEARLAELMTLIGREYVRPIAGDSLRGAASRLLAGSLDPYSRVLDPAAWADLDDLNSGTHTGIGVRVDFDSSSTTARVVGLVRGSPALRAGLRVNDALVEIDGRAVAGQSMDDLLGALRGPKGTAITLTVRRPGVPADLRYAMKRSVMPSPTVRGLRRTAAGEWDYIADAERRIGYVRIEHFSQSTPAELDRALAALRRADAVALVLDLRVNPGGLAKAALQVADRFVDSGTLFTFRHRGALEVFPAHPGSGTGMPLAVLMDGYTQSVAELVSASLQDHHRAVMVGARSWGKGHGQQIYRLADGKTMLKLTTFELVRPSGRPMERHFADRDSTLGGVWPDSGMAVTLTTAEYDRWLDGLFALDDLMPLAAGPGPAAVPAVDRALDTAVSALRERLPR
jgi:carboxyl-terminal processing protease